MTSHVVHLGDCLGPEGLASLPDKSVDHVITDPPYETEAHSDMVRRLDGPGRGASVPVAAPLDFGSMDERTRSQVAREMARVARRWVVVFCQAEGVSAWRSALQAGGASYRRACVWVKPDGMPQISGDRPGMGYESIVTAHAPGRSRWNGGGRVGVYTFLRCQGGRASEHPTQKPRDLMEALVRDFTDAGETIIDPFAGSGTTGVACKRLGRSFIGWERDPKYHRIAEKRIAEAREQLQFAAVSEPTPRNLTMLDDA